jgi:hypothetical protein
MAAEAERPQEVRMPCPPSRLLPTLALLALVLVTPALATALPQSAPLRSATERAEAAPGLFAKLWELLSAVWTTGSILDPNGTSGAVGPGSDPDIGSVGDTGSGLDPNG